MTKALVAGHPRSLSRLQDAGFLLAFVSFFVIGMSGYHGPSGGYLLVTPLDILVGISVGAWATFRRNRERPTTKFGRSVAWSVLAVILAAQLGAAFFLPVEFPSRERAQDKAAQSSLRNALVAAKIGFAESDAFGGGSDKPLTADQLHAIEPVLIFTDAPSTESEVVSFAIADVDGITNQRWSAAALSATGVCWYIRDDEAGASAGVWYGSGDVCTGEAAAAASESSW